jgi:hypothetical protein
MKQLGEAAQTALRHRQWHWCRRLNGFSDRAMWRLVAARLAMKPYQVIAFVNRLEEFANAADQRGQVDHFNAAEFGEALGMPEEEAARIFAALEDIGWIVFDHVTDFTKRNPDVPDNTTAERQRRYKARQRVLKLTAALSRTGRMTPVRRNEIEVRLKNLDDDELVTLQAQLQLELSTGDSGNGVSSRDFVTVTAEQTTQVKSSHVDNSGTGTRGEERGPSEDGVRGEGSDPQAAAKLWIETDGLKLLVERMEWPLTRASMMMLRWLDQNIAGDAIALSTILKTEDARGYIGPRFHTNVTDAIDRHMRLAAQSTAQPTLPLGGIQRLKSA